MISRLSKLALVPVLLAVAIVMAAIFGAVHNQISYSVGPVYFHNLKFAQFGIAPELHNRIGAALVGLRATWWMGVLLGCPILLICLFIRGVERLVTVFLKAVAIVLISALVIGLGGLCLGLIFVDETNLPTVAHNLASSNPASFAHAAIMHEASYIGAGIGAILGAIYAIVSVFRSRSSKM